MARFPAPPRMATYTKDSLRWHGTCVVPSWCACGRRHIACRRHPPKWPVDSSAIQDPSFASASHPLVGSWGRLISMSITNNTQRPATALKRGATDPVHYRPEADYSIVRIIACRIAWLTATNQWTNEPHRRARYNEREAAYGVAQACRGLLVIGCGLVDYSDPLTQ